jgi:hypothetical protein
MAEPKQDDPIVKPKHHSAADPIVKPDSTVPEAPRSAKDPIVKPKDPIVKPKDPIVKPDTKAS